MFQKIKKVKNIRILFLYLYLYKNMKKYRIYIFFLFIQLSFMKILIIPFKRKINQNIDENNLMQNLSKLPGEIKNRIEQSENLIKNEDAEDQKLRSQYGTKWNRRQSSDLNGNYINTLNDYKNKLQQAMQCDQNTINDIQNNLKYFDLLSLSREALDQKIPHRVDSNAIKQCKEAGNPNEDKN